MRLLPISKTVEPARLKAALQLGLDTFGENRVQEAEDKAGLLESAHWELVGHLQSNKVTRALALFDAIHSVNSLELAQRIGGVAIEAGRAPYGVFLQVNVDEDPAKSGFAAGQLEAQAAELVALDGLTILGLMTVGRLVPDQEAARPTFRALRHLSERLQSAWPQIGAGLSMGMSDDFEVAVEEGATLVRLGRVLFGDRPQA